MYECGIGAGLAVGWEYLFVFLKLGEVMGMEEWWN